MKNKLPAKKYKIFILFIFFFCFLTISCSFTKTINLNNEIVWVETIEGDGFLKTRDGQVLVGNGFIALWGKHPYLTGTIITNGVLEGFIIDLRNYNVERFIINFQNYNVVNNSPYDLFKPTGINSDEFQTFGTFKGQWAKEGKLEELRKNLAPPEKIKKSDESEEKNMNNDSK